MPSRKLKTHFSRQIMSQLSPFPHPMVHVKQTSQNTSCSLSPGGSVIKTLMRNGNCTDPFSSSAWGNQSFICHSYQRCVYPALKILCGQDSLDFPKQFALLLHSPPSCLFTFFFFCDTLSLWLLVISRKENNAPTCCVFPYQQCRNHFDHPVTLLRTLSTLLAQCPELDAANSPLCWAKSLWHALKTLPLFMHPNLSYAFFTTRGHCWLTFHLSPTVVPRSFLKDCY